MNKLAFLISCLLLLAPLALAKNKLAFQWKCGSPLEKHTIDVGDRANHSYSISKIACSPGKSSLQEKSGVATRFEDSAETFDNWHGILVATAENGDKIYYSYASKDDAVRKDGKFNRVLKLGQSSAAPGCSLEPEARVLASGSAIPMEP